MYKTGKETGEIEVTADLPGMDEKDVEVTLDEDLLTIRGERREDHEEREKNYRLTECCYGAFDRVFSLHGGVDVEHAKAKFTKGVLTVTLPKTPEARQRKKQITVNPE